MGKSETVDEDGGIDEDDVRRREEKGSSFLFFSDVSLSRILVPIFLGLIRSVPL
jgi:hypothetical protein